LNAATSASPPPSPSFEIGLGAFLFLLCIYLLRNRDRYMRVWFRRSPESADSRLVRGFIFVVISFFAIFALIGMVSMIVNLFR